MVPLVTVYPPQQHHEGGRHTDDPHQEGTLYTDDPHSRGRHEAVEEAGLGAKGGEESGRG